MALRSPAGAEVALFVDIAAAVAVGDVIETRSGRRYGVLSVRFSSRKGAKPGRQHLRCVVLNEKQRPRARTHRIRWHRSPGGGVHPKR